LDDRQQMMSKTHLAFAQVCSSPDRYKSKRSNNIAIKKMLWMKYMYKWES